MYVRREIQYRTLGRVMSYESARDIQAGRQAGRQAGQKKEDRKERVGRQTDTEADRYMLRRDAYSQTDRPKEHM